MSWNSGNQVNVLTHTAEISFTEDQGNISYIKKLLKNHHKKKLKENHLSESKIESSIHQPYGEIVSGNTSSHSGNAICNIERNAAKSISDVENDNVLNGVGNYNSTAINAEGTEKISMKQEVSACNSKEQGDVGKEQSKVLVDSVDKSEFTSLEDLNEIVNDAERSMPEGLETKSPTGGALWDIFRREDTGKLQEYLTKHHREFKHVDTLPVTEVNFGLYDYNIKSFCFSIVNNKRFTLSGSSPHS